MKRLLFIYLIFTITFNLSFAQETGSFDKTITFNDQERTISFYVPNDYNSEQSYGVLVGLHGLGDNSNNFRNAIGATFSQALGNFICVFPDGGDDQNSDFYAPAGDEQIIVEAINLAKEDYNIDENKIILEGFSLGGRSALKFGLENTEMFYGLLLHTPAIQGTQDALNNPLLNFGFAYENAPKIPIIITYGLSDVSYAIYVPVAYDQLVENDGLALSFGIPNMGHTVPTNQEIFDLALDFFEDHIVIEKGVDIYDSKTTQRTCVQNIEPVIRIRNLGSTTVTSLEFEYTLNDNTQTFSWTGELNSFELTELTCPQVTLSAGYNDIDYKITKINDVVLTEDELDDITVEIIYSSGGQELPYYESFEGDYFPPDFWVFETSRDLMDWELTSGASEGTQSISAINLRFISSP